MTESESGSRLFRHFLLLFASSKNVHFVGPLGKFGYDGLWSDVAVAVSVAVVVTVCTVDLTTGSLFIWQCFTGMLEVSQCKCRDSGRVTVGY